MRLGNEQKGNLLIAPFIEILANSLLQISNSFLFLYVSPLLLNMGTGQLIILFYTLRLFITNSAID